MKLICIVYGQEYEVEAGPEQTLTEIRQRALDSASVTGRVPSQFELRNEKGEPLDPTCLLSASGLKEGEVLWVSLAVACGGSNKINHRRKHQRIKTDCRSTRRKRKGECCPPFRNTSGHYHNGVRWMKREGIRTCRRAGWPSGTVRYIQPIFKSPSKLRALILGGE